MPSWLYRFLFWIGGAVCHQQPARSLMAGDRIMVLCARCTGVYLSMFITAAGLLAFWCADRFFCKSGDNASLTVRHGKKALAYALWAALFLLPMEVDGLASLTGLWRSEPWVRLLTGGAFGFGLPVFFVLAVGYRLDEGSFIFPRTMLRRLLFLCAASLAAAVLCAGRWQITGEGINVFAVLGLLTALTGLCYLLFHIRAQRLLDLPTLPTPPTLPTLPTPPTLPALPILPTLPTLPTASIRPTLPALSVLSRLLLSLCVAWAVIGGLHAVKYGWGLLR